jgi:hypothetical protein
LDSESARRADLKVFLRDLALCLSVHRDRSPALVWPEGADTVLGRIFAAHTPPSTGYPDPGADRVVPAGPETADLTTGLGALLGCVVHSGYRVMPRGSQTSDIRAPADLVLLPIRGGCDCHIEPLVDSTAPAVLDKALHLRLRVGEALHIPARFVYSLTEVHAPCTLLVLSFHAASW